MTYNTKDLVQSYENGYKQGMRDMVYTTVGSIAGIALLIGVLVITVGK